MNCSFAVAHLLVLATLAWGGLGGSMNGTRKSGAELRERSNLTANCPADDEINETIRKLTGSNPDVLGAQKRLLETSKHSPQCRSRIIAAIMKVMDRTSLDIVRDQTSRD